VTIQVVFIYLSICHFACYRKYEKDNKHKAILIDGQRRNCMECRYTNSHVQQLKKSARLYIFLPPMTTRKRRSPGTVCNNCYISLPFPERYVTMLLHNVPQMATLCNKDFFFGYISSPFAVRFVTTLLHQCIASNAKSLTIGIIHTRVVQKVRGQLRFYQFNWVNIYILYIRIFVVKFQIKIMCILIISKFLHEKIAI
jgi:hypothetical protein